MYLLRRTHPEDLEILQKLARMVHFINLPADKDLIGEKIQRSRISFRHAATGAPLNLHASDGSAASMSPLFMFTVEDSATKNALGTSMIVARMGGPGYPNLSFTLTRKEKFSQDLQMGIIHTIARLTRDESGPTELGGLILGPSFRRHPAKLGKQLSLIRFHYIGLHREWFSDRIIAEMMAPITADGRNAFWDALGRLFINLTYEEADRFCQHSREFMTSLLPEEDIYLTLLPPEATKGVGQVGRDTLPARRMLEDLGFRFTNRIDPFDGGPHLEANTDEIEIVRNTRRAEFAGIYKSDDGAIPGFVSFEDETGRFRAVHAMVVETSGGNALKLSAQTVDALDVEKGAVLGFTPLDLSGSGKKSASADVAKKPKSKRSKVNA